MAAGLSVGHELQWMQDRLDAASPDLLREMIKMFADVLMGAKAEALCNASQSGRQPASPA